MQKAETLRDRLLQNSPGETEDQKKSIVKTSVRVLKNLFELHGGDIFCLDAYQIGLLGRSDFEETESKLVLKSLQDSGIIIEVGDDIHRLDENSILALEKICSRKV